MKFSTYIKKHRTAAGLTQLELAERAHLSLNVIGFIERGRHPVAREHFEILATVIPGVTIDGLKKCTFKGKKYRNPKNRESCWFFEQEERFARLRILDGNWYIGPVYFYRDHAEECESEKLRRINKRNCRRIGGVWYVDINGLQIALVD